MNSEESHRDWESRLSNEAMAAGRHIPHHWEMVYDDGGDGCMPSGWYLMGCDDSGIPITWPI